MRVSKESIKSVHKYMYEENQLLPIKYDGDNYIDIYLEPKETKKASTNMQAWSVAIATMFNYLKYYNKIHNRPVYPLLYKDLYYTLKYQSIYNKDIDDMFEILMKYLKDPNVIDDVIILAFKDAQNLYLNYPNSIKMPKKAMSFTIFASRISDISENNIHVNGFGDIITEAMDPDMYTDKVTIKISRSKVDDSFIMELGKLIQAKNFRKKAPFHGADIDRVEICADGTEIIICKEIEL